MSQLYEELNPFTQENREISIDTPLGKDVLLLSSFSGEEALSSPFVYQLELLSGQEDIKAADIVGENVNIFVNTGESSRCFNGFVKQFAYKGSKGRGLCVYEAEVVPWLWFLTRHEDCRVFQNMSVVEVVEEVFSNLGFMDYSTSCLIETYDKYEYCVQYNESDFDFVSRLLESEGIYYYFSHEVAKHTLVLADHKTTHKFLDRKEVEHRSGTHKDEFITSWQHQHQYFSGKCSQSDFDFEKFSGSLVTESQAIKPCKNATNYELYQYPGLYKVNDKGRKRTNLKMEREEVSNRWVTGESSRTDLEVGKAFTLTPSEYPVDEGKNFVITHLFHSVAEGSYIDDSEHLPYSNSFRCISDSLTFRPELRSPKPKIDGVQTALVVGPSGEEIHTDQYGRIKVQFPWDRYGPKDDSSSCWVRVASQQAGKKWGVVGIPRVGNEVVVTFEGGDPDKPLVIGSLFNNENMPPIHLPAGKNQTGMKSKSTKNGPGQNEIVMDDTKGQEQMNMHASYDCNMSVDNNLSTTVVKNASLKVDVDSSTDVKANNSTTVGGNNTLTVKGNYSGNITGNKEYTVKKNQTETVTGDLTIKAKNQKTSIEAEQKNIVSGSQINEVTADQKTTAKNQINTISADQTNDITGGHSTTAKKIELTANTEVSITGSTKVSLTVGGNSIVIDNMGVTISVGGSSLKVDALGVTASGAMVKMN